MIDDEVVWELQTHRQGARSQVVLTGELDLDSAPSLLTAVVEELAAGANEVIVDLSGLVFIDSSGLGTLVGCWRRAKNAGAALTVANPGEDVRTTLEITGLDQILPITSGAVAN
ncbi:STAS domain-containing protein [Dactylosporangium sp. CA-139066]|uniref:STAS domain-containing protein n=1 Tax=Dactylosporangium sp. CA-139066 TaxID=3239930 RepID=UPI003D93ADFB